LTTVHLSGIHTIVRISICSSESNIVSHICFQNSGVCHMKKGFVSSVCGLEERRNRTDLIELFKLVKDISSTALNEFFCILDNTGTRGHSWKLSKNHCHCNAHFQFFSQRVVNRWNSLSQEDVDASSVNAFKGRLERRRRHQMDFFKDN